MKIMCAWCEVEGRPANLGEREPLDDPSETHGVCRRHELELLGRLPSRSFPGVQLLLVVRPRESELYERLQRESAGVRGVQVILEQRRTQRRVRRREMYALGYSGVRFGR